MSLSTIRLEAENMLLSTYRQESNSLASGGNLISLYQSGGTTGTATATFSGPTGNYDVIIGYVDENDGASTIDVQIGETTFSWTLDQNLGSGGVTSNTLVRRTIASGLSLSEGTSIKLQGGVNGSEFARIDYIEFIPVSAAPAPLRLEAENMLLSTYRKESNSLASGGNLISLYQSGGTTGTATATFTGSTGYYDVVVGYVDENDGASTLNLEIGNSCFSWSLDQNLGSGGVTSNTLVRRTIASGLSLSEGTSIKLQGGVNGSEFARIDYIEFIPVSAAPAPLRLEAEALSLSTYRKESNSLASGGNLISLYQSGGTTGTATATFTGSTGYYDVVVGYVDENDGASTLNLEIGNSSFSWTLDQNLGSGGVTSNTLVRRTIASGLSLSEGTSIKLQGGVNGSEFARIDYIEFIPIPAIVGTSSNDTLSGNSQNNLLDGLEGNDVLQSSGGDDSLRGGLGTDTVSYAGASSAVVVNLATGVGFVSAYGPTLDIMPLGDSITYGVINSTNTESGGYRTELWKTLGTDGLNINFVGSLTSGPSTLGDKNHEGRRGYRIDQIAASINTWLDAHKPEAVLLMIGTNDILQDYALGTAPARLSSLIDQITTRMPNTQVLVATIPPSSKSSSDAQQVIDFNAALPGIVDSKVAEGKKVSLVNIFDALRPRDLADTIHPTAEGYRKIANTWHDPLLAASGDYATLRSIENVVGSAYKDRLIGSAGANVLQGGMGQDTLTGGGGADAFIYKTAGEGLDTITDFLSDDRFHISAAGFGGGLQVGTPLSTTESATGVFVSGTSPTPIGSSANFLYNTSTGLLNFDRDGNGSSAAVAIATLNGAPSLSASQFTIVA